LSESEEPGEEAGGSGLDLRRYLVKEGGAWKVVDRDDSESQVRELNSTVSEESGSGDLTISATLGRFTYDYLLSEFHTKIESFDESVYKGVLGRLFVNQDVHFVNLSALTEEEWVWLSGKVSDNSLKSLYQKDASDNLWKPKGTSTTEKLNQFYKAALGIVSGSPSVFISQGTGGGSVTHWVGFWDESLRNRLRTYADELVEYAADKKIEFDDYFDAYTLKGNNYYYPKNNLDAGKKAALGEFLLYYLKERELFDFYRFDNGEGKFVLNTNNLSDTKLRELGNWLTSLDLKAPGKLERSITYSSTDMLEVQEADFPGSNEEISASLFEDTAVGYLENTDSDREGSMVVIPYYRGSSGGRRIAYDIQYIHVFDSQNDFSGASLGTDGFDGWEDIEFEGFSDHLDGGVYGWSYGIWAGDKAWDESKFYEKREEDTSLGALRTKAGDVSKKDESARESFRGSFDDESSGNTNNNDVNLASAVKDEDLNLDNQAAREFVLRMYPDLIDSSTSVEKAEIPETPSDADMKKIVSDEKYIEHWGSQGMELEEGPIWAGGIYLQGEVEEDDDGDERLVTYKIATVIDSSLIYPT
ncbi:hypothetical protein S1OALGB6SA_1153, partial [Olavius algarvensis spirochete endosymbiont]|uniref:hypothetical protein n=1 Tax=Olavius algarvensis spirochete endosymbiont TaxID=260710 RepID=UPI000F22CABD